MCKIPLHYRLFFTFLTSVVSLGRLLYICIAGRGKFTEMQNPQDVKILNVYLESESTSLMRNFAQLCWWGDVLMEWQANY